MIVSFDMPNIYFKKRLASATGIALCGAGLGGLVIPLVVESLIEKYHYHGAFLINGAMALNTAVSAAVFRPLKNKKGGTRIRLESVRLSPSTHELIDSDVLAENRFTATTASEEKETGAYEIGGSVINGDAVTLENDSDVLSNGNVQQDVKSISSDTTATTDVSTISTTVKKREGFAWEIFKDVRFWILGAAMVCQDAGAMNYAIYLPYKSIEIVCDAPYKSDDGKCHDNTCEAQEVIKIAMAVSIFSAFDMLGRLLISALWDHGWFKRMYSRQIGYVFFGLTCGAMIAGTMPIQSFLFIQFYVSICGFLSGAGISPVFVIVQDIAGKDRYQDALSACMLVEAPMNLMAPMLIGKFDS